MVMTPQLRKFIDKMNEKKEVKVYNTADKKQIKILKQQNMLTVTSDSQVMVDILAKVLDAALRGELQRKPLTKDKN